MMAGAPLPHYRPPPPTREPDARLPAEALEAAALTTILAPDALPPRRTLARRIARIEALRREFWEEITDDGRRLLERCHAAAFDDLHDTIARELEEGYV